MRIALILIQTIVISLIIYSIAHNDAIGFSISEEMDYSVPFDFLSKSDDGLDVNEVLNENNSIIKAPNKNYLPENMDLKMSTESQEGSLKTRDSPRNLQYTEFKNDDSMTTFSKSELNSAENIGKNQIEPLNDNKHKNNLVNLEKEKSGDDVKKYTSNEKIAIINFDDNWKSQYENAKPILDEFNFKSTFYVVCDYLDGKNRMSWQDILKLQEEGHEIGSHTLSHENLDKIAIDSQHREIVQSKKCLEDKGIKITSFSYPFNSGDNNPLTLDLVSQNYNFARTAGGGGDRDNDGSSLGDYEGYERYTIVGWSHDATRKENNYSDLQMLEAFEEYLSKYDNEAKINNIPIIIYHNIEDTPGMYNTSIELFRAEMQYLYENGFKVITMDEVFG